MVLRAADAHPATASLWSRCFMRRCHVLSPTLQPVLRAAHTSHLPTDQTLPCRVGRQHIQVEDLVPKGGQWCQDRWPWASGGAMWTYRKLGCTWGPRCLQWHESVLATESPSSFPAVKMAFCESSTILLIMERSPPDRLLALDSRTVAFHVYWNCCLGSGLHVKALSSAFTWVRGEPEGRCGSCQLHPPIAQEQNCLGKKRKNPLWPKT